MVGCRAQCNSQQRTQIGPAPQLRSYRCPLRLRRGLVRHRGSGANLLASLTGIKFEQKSPDLTSRRTRARRRLSQGWGWMRRGLMGEIALFCSKPEGGWPLASTVPTPWVGPLNSPYNGTRGISDEGCHMQGASREGSGVLPEAPRKGGVSMCTFAHLSTFRHI